MINKRLDDIMCDYVAKASKFCHSYVEEVLGKNYSSYSGTVSNIYSNFEDELWRLKHEAELAMYNAVDIATNNGEEVGDIKSVQADLFTLHKYYKYFYSGKIAEGLAKSWIKAGNEACFDLIVNKIAFPKEYSHKGGNNV